MAPPRLRYFKTLKQLLSDRNDFFRVCPFWPLVETSYLEGRRCRHGQFARSLNLQCLRSGYFSASSCNRTYIPDHVPAAEVILPDELGGADVEVLQLPVDIARVPLQGLDLGLEGVEREPQILRQPLVVKLIGADREGWELVDV